MLCPTILSFSQGKINEGEVNLHRIGFTVAPSLGYLKDLNYSILNYKESGTAYSIEYIREREKHLLNAEVDFTSGNLKTKATNFFNTPFLQGNVSFSTVFLVKQISNNAIKVYAGGQLNSYLYYLQWGAEMDSWSYLMAHGLNLRISSAMKISDRNRFTSDLSIPVISDFIRPPYNGFNEHIVQNQERVLKLAFEGKPASLDKYFSVVWRFVYHFSMGEHVDFTTGYLARYQHVTGFNVLTYLQNQLFAGLDIKF